MLVSSKFCPAAALDRCRPPGTPVGKPRSGRLSSTIETAFPAIPSGGPWAPGTDFPALTYQGGDDPVRPGAVTRHEVSRLIARSLVSDAPRAVVPSPRHGRSFSRRDRPLGAGIHRKVPDAPLGGTNICVHIALLMCVCWIYVSIPSLMHLNYVSTNGEFRGCCCK